MYVDKVLNNILGKNIKSDNVSFNKNGAYGCRQCQCEPSDKYCQCLCHEGEDD